MATHKARTSVALTSTKHTKTSKQGVNWAEVRGQFKCTKERIQMANFQLTAHPKSVRKAIRKHRKGLDRSPVEYWEANAKHYDSDLIPQTAARYLGCNSSEIAFTDSTTMGLGLLYGGFKLNAEDQVLTTTHCHYSTVKALEFAADRVGASVNSVSLYKQSAFVSEAEIVANFRNAISPNTRLVALTYVHSGTGVKLPIQKLSKIIALANKTRCKTKRIYLCVDAVHAFGIEDFNVQDLGCDYLVAGAHKWLFGPRGTGIIWAKKDAWNMICSIIPPFSRAMNIWMGITADQPLDFRRMITPGGFHSFEHRWALAEAFEFHLNIGKANIQNRTHELNRMLKKGIKCLPHIQLYTPMSGEMSSGINCFEVQGMSPNAVVKKLLQHNIIASTSPYKKVLARLTPSIINTEGEIAQCLHVLEHIHIN